MFWIDRNTEVENGALASKIKLGQLNYGVREKPFVASSTLEFSLSQRAATSY
jgi:hypothetical protein